MSLDFDTRFPRFSIGPNDRVTIKGRAFRLVQRMSNASVLIPADGEGLAETFRFALLNALSAKGKVRREVDYYLPAFQRAPAFALAACAPVGDLPAAVKARLDVRNALVEGFKELYRAGLVKKTSRSVDAMEEQILDARAPISISRLIPKKWSARRRPGRVQDAVYGAASWNGRSGRLTRAHCSNGCARASGPARQASPTGTTDAATG
jgi:putative transposase